MLVWLGVSVFVREIRWGTLVLGLGYNRWMNSKWLKKIEKILLSEAEIVRARLCGSELMSIEDVRGDDGDTAQAIYRAQLSTRFQGRDLKLLQKIEYALSKIKTGEFGVCEECEEPISIKRIEARPVTTLCIDCKESQEKVEGAFFEF